MNVIIILLFLFIVGLSVCFYFLHKRLENLALLSGKMMKDMDILYANQQTLESDIKKVFNELQNAEKEINRLTHN